MFNIPILLIVYIRKDSLFQILNELKKINPEKLYIALDYPPIGNADAIKKNALRKPTNKTLEERPEMQKLYDGFAKENKDYFNYTLLAKSHTKFFMREEQILSDAEYALARATRILNSRAANKVLENTKKEEGKIDEELEKLKRELNKIEE